MKRARAHANSVAAERRNTIRFEAAVRNISEGLSMFDAEGKLVICNEQYASIYELPAELTQPGTPHAGIVAHRLEHGMQPLSSEDFLAEHREVLREGRAAVVTVRLGNGRVISIRHQPIADGGWVATHHDITDEIARANQLELQSFRFATALDNMRQGLCMFDRDKRLIVSNRRYAEMYKIPPDRVRPGMALDEILRQRLEAGNAPVEGMNVFVDKRLGIVAENEPCTFEIEMADGRVISIQHQPFGEGCWVATHEDITDEVARARQLELQSLRFATALDNMRQGLCMFDRDKRLIVSNRRYAEMYKIPSDRVTPGMTLEEILRQRLEAGNAPVGGKNDLFDKLFGVVADNEPRVYDIEMTDGRVISIQHQPFGEGCWVATHEDITEQRRHQARIRHLAGHDLLTDLPNRISFRESLGEVKARARNGEKVGVLFVDLDYFKGVNDTLGHAVGDAVLKRVSQELTECLREGDIVARLGGDEFAILAGRLDKAEDAGGLAERIVRRLAEPFDIDGHRVLIGASVGIAVAPIDGDDAELLIRRADLAMHRAKTEGRGAYHFYQEGLDSALQDRRNTEAGLRNALLRKEFRLMFQPLINLGENRVCAFEALLRWQHPERGLLGPGAFITAAEESGLIVPIGEWVLREACAIASGWPGHISVAVNLSPIQFRKNRQLVEQVKSALSAAALTPDRLELEITELVLLADDECTGLTLRELKQLGVKIALDDFGTGYSSLSYLRRFPFDKIKIDRSFVQDSAENADSLAIIKAVIALGRSLGMATVAEGVETEAQLDIVREHGCTEVQGFLFSVPLPVQATNEFADRLDPRRAAMTRIKLAS